jgi:nucleoside-diphosphate-sugar epimerase
MKILLTGATGFIGGHFLKLLLREHEVFVLIRDNKRSTFCPRGGCQVIVGDLLDQSSLKLIPKGIDLLCHAAGVLGKWGVRSEIYRDVHINGTDNLLKACVNKEIGRIIYISSAGTLGSGTIDEQSSYNPKSIYEITKAEAEKNVLKFSQNHGIRLNILSPEFVYGEGNLHILGLFKSIKQNNFFFINKGNALMHPTYIGDLVQALDLVIKSKTTTDRYIIAGQRSLTVREFAGIIARSMNVALPMVGIPYSFAKASVFVLEFTAKLLHFEPVFTQSRLDFFTKNKNCCIKRATLELGYRPIELELGISKTVRWYKENGYL